MLLNIVGEAHLILGYCALHRTSAIGYTSASRAFIGSAHHRIELLFAIAVIARIGLHPEPIRTSVENDFKFILLRANEHIREYLHVIQISQLLIDQLRIVRNQTGRARKVLLKFVLLEAVGKVLQRLRPVHLILELLDHLPDLGRLVLPWLHRFCLLIEVEVDHVGSFLLGHFVKEIDGVVKHILSFGDGAQEEQGFDTL